MRNGIYGTLNALTGEINRQDQVKQDAVVSTSNLAFQTRDKTSFLLGKGSEMVLQSTNLCRKQIATRSGIGNSYLNQMINTAPDLLDANINYWFTADPRNRLIRTLDGKVRAFMSDRYKTIDNKPVFDTIMQVTDGLNGIEIASCDITDNKMYLKVKSPKLEGEVSVGDPIQMGLSISNSEVGLGALHINPMIYRLVCSNGMVSGTNYGDSLKRTHLGSKHDLGIVYSRQTQEVINEALMLQIGETIKAALSPETFKTYLDKFKDVKQQKITGNVTEAVAALGKLTGFNKTEGEQILNRLVDGGDRSQYGLMNAVTAFAQDDSLSYDRASQIEAIGGKVLELSPRQWKTISEAA